MKTLEQKVMFLLTKTVVNEIKKFENEKMKKQPKSLRSSALSTDAIDGLYKMISLKAE